CRLNPPGKNARFPWPARCRPPGSLAKNAADCVFPSWDVLVWKGVHQLPLEKTRTERESLPTIQDHFESDGQFARAGDAKRNASCRSIKMTPWLKASRSSCSSRSK